MSTPHLAQLLSYPPRLVMLMPLSVALVVLGPLPTRLGSANFPFFAREPKKPESSLKNGALAGAISCARIGVCDCGETHGLAGAATDLAVDDLRNVLIPLEIEKLRLTRFVESGWDVFEPLETGVDESCGGELLDCLEAVASSPFREDKGIETSSIV